MWLIIGQYHHHSRSRDDNDIGLDQTARLQHYGQGHPNCWVRNNPSGIFCKRSRWAVCMEETGAGETMDSLPQD